MRNTSKLLEYDQGTETGYMSDSSLNSRRGNPESLKDLQDERPPSSKNKKTKSERNKRRSSRISLLNEGHVSGSENSSNGSLEANQVRYRKRAGSKRNECENKENVELYRKRTSSKTSSSLNSTEENKTVDSVIKDKNASTTTLKMNTKDIYFGTWNPKERAVLDQVLHNIDLKPDKKSFKDRLKIKKETKIKKEKFSKITEEEDLPNYPFCQYNKPVQRSNKNRISGIFSGLKRLKESVLKRHDTIDEDDGYSEDPFQGNRKKKSIFRRFGKKKEFDMPRRRAHSTNDYMHSTRQPEPPSNLSKTRSGSSHSLRSLFARTKSVDNLNGAFEYFANKKEVFQRTPSVINLPPMQALDSTKRSSSQKSLNHGFEPVQPSAKELCFDNKELVYAKSKIVQLQTASQRSLNASRHFQGYYDSAYEDDYYSRDYQSDRSPSVVSASPMFHYNHCSDSESASSARPHSSMSVNYPKTRPLGYGPPPPPHGYFHGYGPPPGFHGYSTPGYTNPFYATPGYGTPGYVTPGYTTPGYATPGYATPGYATPGMQSGYTSENDYASLTPANISMIPYQARKAIQRSLSKNSSTSNYSSNYSYISDASFCDEDVYGVVQPSKLRRNLSRKSNRSTMSTVL